ncbi:hypothetical protein [Nonomuraea diastatica]|nr:hypothetical protein [Nonomuraea diastatica]
MAPALALLTLGAAIVGLRATALQAPHQLPAKGCSAPPATRAAPSC